MIDGVDPMIQRAQARVGQVLRGKWKLDRLLGIGGMASVYAATHRNGKRGAVKMLHVELSFNEDARSRFLREGYVANKVDHHGSVSVLDDDVTEEGAVFLVMELLEGTAVDAIREARPSQRLEVGEAVAVGMDLLGVLAAAHDKGIVHRDLKPENVFITKKGELKVLDFGIARLREIAGSASATRTGSMMGTPAFMPPEQALGNWDQVDGRSDLWAVGATMFILLTGRHVHAADTVNKVLLLAMSKPAPPIASVWPAVPPPIAAVIDHALAFEQAHRWADARTMQQALRAAAQPILGSWSLPPAVATSPLGASVLGPAASGGGTESWSSAAQAMTPMGAVQRPSAPAPSSAAPTSAMPSRTPSGTELGHAPSFSGPAGILMNPPAATFSGAAMPAAAPGRKNLGLIIGLGVVGLVAAAGVALFFIGQPQSSSANASAEPSSPSAAPTPIASAAAVVAPASAAPIASAEPSAVPSSEPSAAPSAEIVAAPPSVPAPPAVDRRPLPSHVTRPVKPATPSAPQDRDHGF